MIGEEGRDWLLFVPLVKAVEKDGRLFIEGIASDESVDLQNEIVKASGLMDSLRFLEERGVLDWDHGRVIGGIDQARLIPVEEARQRFPELDSWYGRDYAGREVFYLHGWLDPPQQGEPDNQPLLDARHAVKAGHRLGFSVAGGRLRRGESRGPDGRVYPSTEQAFLTRVALTPCPVNPNTVARMAKSLSAALREQEQDQEQTGGPPVVVLDKSLTVGAATDSAAMTGARALVPESLQGGTQDVTWTCPLCAVTATAATSTEAPPRCRVCGGEMVRMTARAAQGGRAVRKGLSPLGSIAQNLKATEATTMSETLEKARDLLTKGVGTFRQALTVLGKALEAEDEDEELQDLPDPDEAEQQEEEYGSDEEVSGGEEQEEGDQEEPELGVQPEEEQPPSKEDVDDLLEQIDELDEDEQDDEAEEQDEDEEGYAVKKSMKELLEEQDEGLVEVLEAEGLLAGVLGAFEKSISARFDEIDETLAGVAEALAAQAEVGEELAKSLTTHAESDEAFRREIGAMPGGTTFHKSLYEPDEKQEQRVEELQGRITKALHSDQISGVDANKLRKRLGYGQLDEVGSMLDIAMRGAAATD